MNQGNGKYTVLFLLKLLLAFIVATMIVNNVVQFENFQLVAKMLITIILQVVMVLVESKLKK